MTSGQKKIVPWILYLVFFSVLNETMFNVSTPRIAERFGLGPAGVGWTMTIFLVFFGIGSMIYGKLADIYGLRGLVAAGVAIYCLGSIVGFALGPSSYLLVVAARAIQGMGASAIPALVTVIVARYFPEAERGRLFGSIMSTASLGIGIGPIIGGFVSGALSWSYLFAIPLFSLFALPFVMRGLPREPRREGGLDLAGALLAASCVGALVLLLATGSPLAIAGLALAALSFVLRIRRAREPFIPPRLFENAAFRDCLVVAFSLFSVVLGTFFLVPLMLHQVHGLGTEGIGLVLFPGAASSVIVGPFGGRLADRRGNPFVVALGLFLLVASMASMSLLLSLSPILVAVALVPVYAGFSLIQTAMVNGASQALPASDAGVGMGLFNLVGIVSGAVGTTLVGKTLEGRWLDFAFLSGPGSGRAYGNILLVFAIVVAAGGFLYLRGSRRRAGRVPCVGEACLEA